MDWFGFDINTSTTPKPWGPREELCIKELIQVLVGNTIGATKRTSGHLHAILHNQDNESVEAFKAYQLSGKNTVDIGGKGEGHDIAIHCAPERTSALNIGGVGPFGNYTAITVHTGVNGTIQEVSMGNHYFGYPLKAGQDNRVYTRDWMDITSLVTVSGFSGFTGGHAIACQEIGNLVIMHFSIFGTSNQTYLRVSLPYNIRMAFQNMTCTVGVLAGYDNGSWIGPVEAAWEHSASRLIFGTPGAQDTFWTASGGKGVQGYLTFLSDTPSHGWQLK